MKFVKFFLMSVILNVITAYGQDSLNVQRVGQQHRWQVARNVAVQGNYAYVAAEDAGLEIFDVTDPESPVEVGYCDTPGWAYHVDVSGNYAYVADQTSGLRIIDVSNPNAPFEAGWIDTPDQANAVTVRGNYAYVADNISGLRIIDVSNPAAPVATGFCDTPSYACDVALSGNTAYVASYKAGLRVIDITNPAAPVSVGYYDTPGDACDVAVYNLIYVADGECGLQILASGAPGQLERIGNFETSDYAYSVTVEGAYAYVADGSCGLWRVKWNDPCVAPYEAVNYDTPGVARGVAVNGGFAYVADGNGLRVIPVGYQEVGSCDTPFNACRVVLNGDLAYVCDGSGDFNGLRVINVSNPSAPVENGSYIPPIWGGLWDVALNDGYAYAACFQNLRVLDISNPAVPFEVGCYPFPRNPDRVVVAGNNLYVLDGDSLVILDITSPVTPTEIGRWSNPSVIEFWEFAVRDDTVYLTAKLYDPLHNPPLYSALLIVEATNPAAPFQLGSFESFYMPNDVAYLVGVAVLGSHAYVVENTNGLHAIDIANPQSPYLVGSWEVELPPDMHADYSRLRVVDNNVYLPYGIYFNDNIVLGFGQIDVSNPAAPEASAYYSTPDWVMDVAVNNGLAYIADQDSGLRVIELAASALTGSINGPGEARAAAVEGNYVYVAAGGSGLQVMDISNPAVPLLIGSCDTPFEAEDLAICGDYAYIVDRNSLRIMDISNPAVPVEVGIYDPPGTYDWMKFLVVRNNYLYLDHYNGSFGVLILDITDPVVPVLAGTYNSPGTPYAVEVLENYLYVADYGSGLRIVNISNPAAPVEVGFYNSPDYEWAVAVHGNIAYVGGLDLHVVNIANPAAPVEVGFYDAPDVVSDVTIEGHLAFITCRESGLRVLDMSDPTAPVLVGYYNTPGWANRVVLSDCRAYVSSLTSFDILDLSFFVPCSSPPVPSAPDSIVIQYQPNSNNRWLTWTPVTTDTSGASLNISHYVIYRSLDLATWDSIGIPNPPDTTVFVDSTTTATQAFYYVKAVTN